MRSAKEQQEKERYKQLVLKFLSMQLDAPNIAAFVREIRTREAEE
jgi:hypothetical protein